MAMDQSALKAAISAAFSANIPNPTSAQQAAFDNTASAIATAIITCIESMSIKYTSGLTAPDGVVGGSLSTVEIS